MPVVLTQLQQLLLPDYRCAWPLRRSGCVHNCVQCHPMARAAYLIYLGIDAMRSRGGLAINGDGNGIRKSSSIFWQAFITDILNPKVVMFFFAFLPQFVDTHGGHPTLQLILLGVTVNMVYSNTSLGVLRTHPRFDD